MQLTGAAADLVAALARARAAADAQRAIEAMAAELRAIYYPKQRAFFAKGGAKWRATRKTRRAGITTAGCRELLARAIETPGFRAMYVAATRIEAKDRAWKSDTKSGLVDVLERLAEPADHPTVPAYKLGGVTVEVREADLTLTFSNGSEIELFGAENLRAHRKKRGGAKHVVWIDEAQDFFLLEEFFDAVVLAGLDDFKGECWLTGTPGRDCAGMFYEITKEPEDGEAPAPGWEVHELAQVDNPFFGHVVTDTTAGAAAYYVEDNTAARTGPYETPEEAERAAVDVRWQQTAGEAMRRKGWKGDEPDFKREYLGKWVKEDARYVYPVHAVPRHQLLFAPQRLVPNPFVGSHPRFDGHPPWYDHAAAVRDLPRLAPDRRPHKWLYAIGVDFGYNPDPFAITMWAFTQTLNDVYEMFSWKQTKLHTGDQASYLKLLWDAVPEVVSLVGDPAGKQDDFELWRTRMGLPIEDANKRGKNTLEEFLANDIRRGIVHLREGSPLYQEMRHLVYLPTKPGKPREVHKNRVVNGVTHGDHCCDASRYSYVSLTHYLAKIPGERPAAGSREAMQAEEAQIERRLDELEARRRSREEQLDADDEIASEYANSGEYQWG